MPIVCYIERGDVIKKRGRPFNNKVSQQIVAFILFSIVKKGFPPTVREIARELGTSSNGLVTYYLRKLKDKGFIEFEFARVKRCARGMKVKLGGK